MRRGSSSSSYAADFCSGVTGRVAHTFRASNMAEADAHMQDENRRVCLRGHEIMQKKIGAMVGKIFLSVN